MDSLVVMQLTYERTTDEKLRDTIARRILSFVDKEHLDSFYQVRLRQEEHEIVFQLEEIPDYLREQVGQETLVLTDAEITEIYELLMRSSVPGALTTGLELKTMLSEIYQAQAALEID